MEEEEEEEEEQQQQVADVDVVVVLVVIAAAVDVVAHDSWRVSKQMMREAVNAVEDNWSGFAVQPLADLAVAEDED
jgi:3-hydroxyisobutyrate dehydrogenase-like beta-hydroxyacid dehydrogenase